MGPPSAADAILRTVCHPHPPATRFRSHGLRALPATLQTRPRHTPTQHARRVQKPTVFVAGVGLIIDVDSSAVNLHCMVKSTPKTFEPEVVQVDDFWVHVAVSRDAHLSKRFQCEVSLYPREADSQWSDLDLSKPWRSPESCGRSQRQQRHTSTALRSDTY